MNAPGPLTQREMDELTHPVYVSKIEVTHAGSEMQVPCASSDNTNSVEDCGVSISPQQPQDPSDP
jgi:hypothetical protein